MIRAHWTALCTLLALLAGLPAHAADPAGMVKVAKGQVSIERDGKKLPATVGSQIEVADRVPMVRLASRCATIHCCRPARIR